VGYRRAEDVPTGPISDDEHGDDLDNMGSFCVRAFGHLCVDDHDEEPRRENGTSSTRLYRLDQIHTDWWPDGLFEKLSGYTWWIDPEDELNLLDVLAAQAGITK